MSTDESAKKGANPQLVKLDQAFKLAEKWVSNMSKTTEDESTRVVLESRPPRLGIGAAVPRQFPVVMSNDPVERKLRAKLDSDKRKFAKISEESAPAARDESSDDDDESESRTKAFVKKKVGIVNPSSPLQKKPK